MSKLHILFFFFFIPTSSFASDVLPMNAYRNEEVDFSVYEKRAIRKLNKEKVLRKSPLSSSRLFGTADLPKAIQWKALSAMQERFEIARDTRLVKTADGSLRRISWMFPDDGCFARASLFNRIMFYTYVPVPSKVFAFGNLRVKTPFSPRGRVGWWYHTAPMVEVGGTKYVLDPSIEPGQPLTLEEWLGRMGEPSKIKVAICNSGTYSPGDDCSKETDGLESRAYNTQLYYLNLEERRIKELGMDPEVILGENPPW